MKLNRIERWVVNNPFRVFEQWMEIGWMKKKMPLIPGGKFLDLGCGRGAEAKLIVEAFQPSRLYALDLDISMVQKANNYLAPRDHDNILLMVGDALHLPFEDASLDAVFGFGFLHHVVNWRGALSEVSRVLKDGGLREELIESAYAEVTEKYNWEKCVDRLEEIYRSVLRE